MGFFDSLFKQAQPIEAPTFPNSCAAIVAILFSAINADGTIDDLEMEALSRAVVLKRAFANHNTVPYYKNAMDLTRKYGGAYVIKTAAETLSIDDKKVSFILTLDLLMANGELNQDEKGFVGDLANMLQIDSAWVDNASEIVMLKYS